MHGFFWFAAAGGSLGYGISVKRQPNRVLSE
jgi:hypothetical protein